MQFHKSSSTHIYKLLAVGGSNLTNRLLINQTKTDFGMMKYSIWKASTFMPITTKPHYLEWLCFECHCYENMNAYVLSLL